MRNLKIKRGDILWIDLPGQAGTSLQSGRRPCVCVSTDKANGTSPVINILPGTSRMNKAGFPVHMTVHPNEINGYLGKDTIFLAEQIATVPKRNIVMKAGHIPENSKAMEEIDRIIRRQLSL